MVSTTYKWSIDRWHELVNSGVLEGQVELLEGDIVVRWFLFRTTITKYSRFN